MCAFMNCCTIISRCRCIFINVCFYELLYNHIYGQMYIYYCVLLYDLLTQVSSKVVNVFLSAVIYVFTVGLSL